MRRDTWPCSRSTVTSAHHVQGGGVGIGARLLQPWLAGRESAFQAGHAGSIPVTRSTVETPAEQGFSHFMPSMRAVGNAPWDP
jgi:hypothetical protein